MHILVCMCLFIDERYICFSLVFHGGSWSCCKHLLRRNKCFTEPSVGAWLSLIQTKPLGAVKVKNVACRCYVWVATERNFIICAAVGHKASQRGCKQLWCSFGLKNLSQCASLNPSASMSTVLQQLGVQISGQGFEKGLLQ